MGSPKTLQNRFTETYKTRYPFANAAMAFVGSNAHLPTAVLNAGAMGTLAVGILSPDDVRSQIAAIRSNTLSRSLNVNLIVPFASDQHIDLLCELKPQVVSFHWGPVKHQWIEQLHAAGITVWEQVGSAESAKRAVDYGVDALIAQGLEAGGHNLSTLPIFVLLPEIIKAVTPVMVIAGGGISNGAQVAAAFALGADAVWVGSRFIASIEASAHPIYKQQVVEADSGSQTVLTHVFGRDIPDFNPMRTITNSTTNSWHHQICAINNEHPQRVVLGHTMINDQAMPVDQFSSFPPTTQTSGDISAMALSCGQGAGCIDSIESVEDIITAMMHDACCILQTLDRSIDY